MELIKRILKKTIVIISIVLLVINLTVLSGVQIASANIFVRAYKTADDFVKGFTKSVSSKSGIELDINQFVKPDGTIDWEDYERQQEMLSNIFYKGVQDGTKEATQELKKVLSGDIDMVKKTPLKNLPGWSKVVVSTGAVLVGADLIYDVYQWTQNGDSGDLETIDGKLTSLRENDEGIGSYYGKGGLIGVTGDYGDYYEKYFNGDTKNNVITDVATWESPFGTFLIEIMTFKSYGEVKTTIIINKTGYSFSRSVGFEGTIKDVLILQNHNGSEMNFIFTKPDEEGVYFNYIVADYNAGTTSETYTIKRVGFGGSYGNDLNSAARFYESNNVYPITNLLFSGSVVEVIPYTVQEVPPLKSSSVVNPINPQTTTTTLIVPEGLTEEQIQEQVKKTPNIMSNPEEFLEQNPDVVPDESGTGGTGGITENEFEELSCARPNKIDFSPIGESFTNAFPFSIPWDIKDFIDNAFGGVGDERPSFKLSFLGDGVVLEIPEYFDSWVNLARMLMVLFFDISVIYMFYRFMKGGSN